MLSLSCGEQGEAGVRQAGSFFSHPEGWASGHLHPQAQGCHSHGAEEQFLLSHHSHVEARSPWRSGQELVFHSVGNLVKCLKRERLKKKTRIIIVSTEEADPGEKKKADAEKSISMLSFGLKFSVTIFFFLLWEVG